MRANYGKSQALVLSINTCGTVEVDPSKILS